MRRRRYSYADDDSIAGIAAARGVTPIEAYIDAMVDSDGRSIVNWPVMNQDEAAIEEMLTSPVTIMGLADAGAHATQIMDASQPTYFLSHWVRDRQAITLEAGGAEDRSRHRFVRRLHATAAWSSRGPSPTST